MEQLLAKAREQVGSVRVRVTDSDGVELSGAAVLVDGKEMGRTPLADEVFIEPGPRVIAARQPGHEDGEKRIEAAKGSSESVTIELAPSKGAARSVETGPAKPAASKKSVAVIAAGSGAAAALLGVGVGFHLASNAKSKDATATWEELKGAGGDRGACLNPANAARCDALRSAHEGRELYRGVAIGGYVAGGVLAVGTLVYALMPGRPPPGARQEQGSAVRAFVSVSPGGGGAVLQGRF